MKAVMEGTWDELAAHASELRRYPRLTLIIPDESPATPNDGMAGALARIADRQRDRAYTSPDETDRLIEEARSGGMYGADRAG